MIASNEKMLQRSRVRSSEVVHVSSDQDERADMNTAEKALQTGKLWVEQHPAAAVVASVMLGLLVGYIVKRRR